MESLQTKKSKIIAIDFLSRLLLKLAQMIQSGPKVKVF